MSGKTPCENAIGTKILVFGFSRSELHFCSQELLALFGPVDQSNPLRAWQAGGLVHPRDAQLVADCLERLDRHSDYCEGSFRLKSLHGNYLFCHCTFSRVLEKGEERVIATLSTSALSDRQRRKQGRYHDPLTGALTSRGFFAAADTLFSANPTSPYCILRFTILGLRKINQTQGFTAGDRLLKVIARMVRNHLLCDKEALARVDGDGFAVCLLGSAKRAISFAQNLTRLCDNAAKHRQYGLYFGICVVNHQTQAHLLYDCACHALKTVRGNNERNVAFYDEPLRKRHADERYITEQMEEALQQYQFKLFLQPKVEISTGRIIGAEALARWLHPEDGMIMPDRFVPLFETNGFVLKLDTFIWEEACKILRKWLDAGYKAVPISVNVSRLHFKSEDLTQQLLQLLAKYHLPTNLLELEITETTFLPNEHNLHGKMLDLRKAGFAISMDDFGIGYSSLNSLRALPFTTMKIDRIFVQDVANDKSRGRIVARNTIALARELGMRIVAEGVETEDQANFLLENGCNCAQGFHYAHPLEAENFAARYLEKMPTAFS
ncbi:MAG: EAL domain-containing protein [Desulfovibrio sp.]|nr:EAL domain-containing protein [Desulfovibrio sp.]